MPYSAFTFARAKADLRLTIKEGARFLPSIAPSERFRETLDESLPWAIAVGSEKAKSEVIVAPLLLEVKRISQSLNQPLSVGDARVDGDPRLICAFS